MADPPLYDDDIGYDDDVYYDGGPPPPAVGEGWTVGAGGAFTRQGTTFLIVELATGDVIDALPLSTHRYTRGLRIPGGWSATIAHDHRLATSTLLDPNRVACYVVDDTNELLFGGIIREPSTDIEEGSDITVGGDGIFGYFRGDGSETGRFLTVNRTYTATSAEDIIDALIVWAQGITGGDIGLEVAIIGTGPGIDFAPKGYELPNIGALIENLAEENGIEWDIDYRWDRTATPPRPVAILTLTVGTRGVRKELDLVAGKNIKVLTYSADGFGQANTVLAAGAGDGKNMLRTTVADPSLIRPAGVYPLLERVVTDKSIKKRARLEQRAQYTLARSAHPARTASVEVITEGTGAEELPFGSFTTGDQVRLFVESGWIQEAGDWWRILGFSVEHDLEGARKVTLDIASADELEV